MSADFSERIKKVKNQKAEQPPRRAADAFAPGAQCKEPIQRTTVNIPQSVYQELKEEAYRTGVPMGTQLIEAWKQARGL